MVDANTGQSLDGVSVVANWRASGATDQANQGQLATAETTTDKNGHFVFQGWGPKIAWHGLSGTQRTSLFLIKSGYQPLALSTEVSTNYGYSPIMQSEWNGKTIRLQTANSDIKHRIQQFDLFNIELHPIFHESAGCPWKKLPNFLREVHKERLALDPYATSSDAWPISSVDQDLINNSAKLVRESGGACGSPKDIFGSN